jgi:hypothetical protein
MNILRTGYPNFSSSFSAKIAQGYEVSPSVIRVKA